MVWELRGEGGWRRGRGRKGVIGWREIGGHWKWRTLEMEEWREMEEKPRKERADWGGTVMEGESWRQRRENLRVKEKRLRGVV